MQNRFRAGQRASEVYSVQGSECWMRMMCGAIIPLGYFFVQAGTIQAVHTLDEKNQNRQGTGKTGAP